MKTVVNYTLIALAWLALSTLNLQLSSACAQGTAFTYQGQLDSGTNLAHGTYNLTFSLFNTNTSGVAIAGPVTNNGVFVTNGLFTVLVDFGFGAFTGGTNWLQIGVQTNGAGSFATLAPRQELTPTPYATYAESAGGVLSGLTVQLNTNGAPNVIGGSSVNSVSNGVIGATIGGGGAVNYQGVAYTNSVTVVFGTVSGGRGNTASGDSAVVGGGFDNTAGKDSATVGGGFNNLASNGSTTVAGGFDNIASGNVATVGGGGHNTASGDYSIVAGGQGNNATNTYATVSGGQGNTADGNSATVGGGNGDQAIGNTSTVGGGSDNVAVGQSATIGGGFLNQASAPTSTVGGGQNNIAGSGSATVGGGFTNRAISTSSTVAGGFNNTASGPYSAVAGGVANFAGGNSSTVGGGQNDSASNDWDTVSGGYYNSAGGQMVTVSGGGNNTASGDFSTVGGGYTNLAANGSATVAGGYNNIASGNVSAVGGGQLNLASGQFATVAGGANNTASGDFSFAAGNQAQALHQGSFVWADDNGGSFASTGINQFSVRAGGGVQLAGNTSIFFGASTRQMLNLYTTLYGVGVQTLDLYFRTDPSGGFSWFKGGTHSDTQYAPGTGGTEVMRLDSGGNLKTLTGTIASLSDRNAKTAFASVNSQDVLARVAALPISTWRYKAADASQRHIGPMAQDFYAAFNVGLDDKSICTVDADGVAMAAIQGLNQKLNEKDTEIQDLKRQNESIAKQLNQLESVVESIAVRK